MSKVIATSCIVCGWWYRSTGDCIPRETVLWRTLMTNRGNSSRQNSSHLSLSDHSEPLKHSTLHTIASHTLIFSARQNVGCLSSEIRFISDFAGSVLHTEEYGYLLTELKVQLRL